MDFERTKAELKERLTDYVESITEKSKGANMYVCPICGSGTGHNHTGAFSIKDRIRWKCFSCGKGGDIFDLIGEVEHIDQPLDQLKRAGELFGVDVPGNRTTAQADFSKPVKDMCIHTYTQTDTDYSAYIKDCAERISETGYHIKRGITPATAERFYLGYDPNFNINTGGAVWKALIIPTGANSFVARNTDPGADSKERYRKSNGKAELFNITAIHTATQPIFIVEGELDALSIIEAGGEAVGLGSTSNVNKFLQYVKENRPKQPLITLLDNDTQGRNAEEKLFIGLENNDLEVYRYDLNADYKDANEWLTKDRENFIKWVANAGDIARIKQEKERAEYYETSAGGHITEFLDGIKAHANTPAQPTGFFNLDSIALDGGLDEGLYIIGAQLLIN